MKADDTAALAPEYLDVYVSSVKENDPFGFSVQILKSDSMYIPNYKELKLTSRRGSTRETHV